jgi:hypothetical protein
LPELFENLKYWNELTNTKEKDSFLVYGGVDIQKRLQGNVVSWKNVPTIFDYIYNTQK